LRRASRIMRTIVAWSASVAGRMVGGTRSSGVDGRAVHLLERISNA
jgi:hypothetical protein